MVAVAAKYGTTKGTVSKWKSKDGNFTSNDGNFTANEVNVPSGEHKYRIKSSDAHLVFEDENGREIRGDSNKSYAEWKVAYERAVDSGAILF